MPVFHVEMLWRCGTCRTENKGRFKTCQSCGKPKEGEPFYDAHGAEAPSIADAVADPALIVQANAGSDWECIYCGSHQRRDSGECATCGAKQGYSKGHETSWDDGATGPSGHGLNEREEIDAEIAKAAEQPKRRTARAPAPTAMGLDIDEPLPSRPALGIGGKAISVIALGAALLGMILYLLFRTTIVDATVATVAWEHKVAVERYQVVRGDGFDETQPADAFGVEVIGLRHHHNNRILDGYDKVPYEDRYQCGETCSTTPRSCTRTPVRCTDNRNGFKSCSGGDERCTGGDRRCTPKYCTQTKYREEPRYRHEPVYEPYYQWKVWRWLQNRAIVERGTNNEPFWPSTETVRLNAGCSDGEQERASRSSAYEVVFEGPDRDRHRYEPKSEGEFRALAPGTKRKMKVRIIGENELLASEAAQ